MRALAIFRSRVLSSLFVFAIAQGLPAQSPAPPDPPAPTLVIVVSGWPEYHYAGCRRLEGVTENLLALSVGQATARGLKPHDECDPSRVRPVAPTTPSLNTRKPGVKPTTGQTGTLVHVVRGDVRYHRASCSKMGIGARPFRLDILAPRYVPCPACRPPVRKRR
jgi:hypothetical protein